MYIFIVNCEWTPWSLCSKLEGECVEGIASQRIRGEMTRKYKQQAGPGGKECVPAFIERQNRLTKAPCFFHCQGNSLSILKFQAKIDRLF